MRGERQQGRLATLRRRRQTNSSKPPIFLLQHKHKSKGESAPAPSPVETNMTGPAAPAAAEASPPTATAPPPAGEAAPIEPTTPPTEPIKAAPTESTIAEPIKAAPTEPAAVAPIETAPEASPEASPETATAQALPSPAEPSIPAPAEPTPPPPTEPTPTAAEASPAPTDIAAFVDPTEGGPPECQGGFFSGEQGWLAQALAWGPRPLPASPRLALPPHPWLLQARSGVTTRSSATFCQEGKDTKYELSVSCGCWAPAG